MTRVWTASPLRLFLAALSATLALQVTSLHSQPPQPPGRPGQPSATVDGHPVVPGEVLVQFESVAASSANQARLGQQVDASINVAVGRQGLRRFRSRAFDVETLLAFFRGQPEVVFAEPNYILEAVAVPNDPSFGNLWGLRNTGQSILGLFGTPDADIDATEAWDISTGSTAHVVGVIDSGVDYTHPDLAANIWSAPAPFTVVIGGVPINCPAGSHGFNAVTRSCNPMDTDGHGTHVSGTIGAVGNNGVGVAGVNWTTRIIGGKFLDGGGGTTSNAIDSIDFMVQVKAAFAATGGADIRVLNNSWGGGGFSTALRNAIITAAASDIMFVAASGNNGRNTDLLPFYPASYDLPSIVSVAATDFNDLLWSGSNFGTTTVDLAAPGVGIYSTIPSGGYAFSTGTSMASPHVAGAAALVLSQCSLDTAGLKAALLDSVDPLGSLFGAVGSGGRLNVDRALRSCAGGGGGDPPLAPANLQGTAGDSQARLTWSPSAGADTYRVKRSFTKAGPFLEIAEVPATSYTDTTVVNGTKYFYKVSALNEEGESPDSNRVKVVPGPVPPAPTGVVAVTGSGIGEIDVSWNASPGAIAYKVKRSKTPGGPYSSGKKVTTLSYTNTGLVSGKTYYFVVTALSATGESAFSVEASAVAR